MARLSHRLVALLLSSIVAGCGSAAGTLPSGKAPAGNGPGSQGARVPVTIRIVVLGRRDHRQPHYLSRSTKGMKIALNGPSTIEKIVGLTPSSPGCATKKGVTACEFAFNLEPCPPKTYCYGGSVTTYDDVACTPKCAIPPAAHVLSANQHLVFSVRRGKANTIRLTLDGIPVSAAIVPGVGSTLSGNSTSGFTISKCVTAAQNVLVVGYDAGHNQIVGAGAPTASLASDDKVHLAAATPSPSASPNAFRLVPPSTLTAGTTIPDAGTAVHLTATVKPLKASGASLAVTAHATVTFNTDVCGVVSEFAVPSKGGLDDLAISGQIAVGPDRNLWFTEECTSKIGKITTSGVITEYSGMTSNAYPFGIVAGPGPAGPVSRMWFSEQGTHKIGTITTGGTISEYTSASLNQPGAMTVGSDGLVWFTDNPNDSIGKITTDGASVLEYAVPTATSAPVGIAAGSDGNLWFTEAQSSKIGKSTTGGVVNDAIDTPAVTASSDPAYIAAGPDGALWFTESYKPNIGRIATDGTVHEYPLSDFGVNDQLVGITKGPDGAIWATENSSSGTGKIWRVTAAGSIAKFSSTFLSFGQAGQITAGPDGALWFTLLNYIGRMQ